MDWRGSARQPLWLYQHHFVPSLLRDSWPCCPSPSHRYSSTHVSMPSSCLVSLSPLQLCWPRSQAHLCPPVGPPLGLPPICELGLCASESTSESSSKFGTRDPLGEETSFAVQSCPVPGWSHSCKRWFPLLSKRALCFYPLYVGLFNLHVIEQTVGLCVQARSWMTLALLSSRLGCSQSQCSPCRGLASAGM